MARVTQVFHEFATDSASSTNVFYHPIGACCAMVRVRSVLGPARLCFCFVSALVRPPLQALAEARNATNRAPARTNRRTLRRRYVTCGR